MKYTAKDCKNHARILAEELGKKFGDCWDIPTDEAGHRDWSKRLRAKIGCWSVDYNPVYGGCIVEEIMNEGGGVEHPLTKQRLPPREFCTAVGIARNVVRIVKETFDAEATAEVIYDDLVGIDLTDREGAVKQMAELIRVGVRR